MAGEQAAPPGRGRIPFLPSLGWQKYLVGLWLLLILLIKSDAIPSLTLKLIEVIWDSGIGYKLSFISIYTFLVFGYLAFSASRFLMNLMAYASYSSTLTFMLCGTLILGVLALADIVISYFTGSSDLLILPALFNMAMGEFNTNITATAGVVNNSINISLT